MGALSLALAGAGVALAAPWLAGQPASAKAETRKAASSKKLPMIRRSEVEKHKTAETGIWVTHGDGVFDITDFVAAHPGGERILLAAGGDVAPYWAMYAQHKKPEV
jgi:sulfite oxidase